MVYWLLLQNQWRITVRSMWTRYHWFVRILLLLFIGYFALSLAIFGLAFRGLLWAADVWERPVPFMNGVLLTGFVGLFTLRFFLQRSPWMRVQAHLHLPVSQRKLTRFFQVYSLLSLHNLLPLVFIIPFWLRWVWRWPYHPPGIWLWLLGFVLVLLISHYLNSLLRSLLTGSREGAFLVLSILVLLVTLDLTAGPPVLSLVSDLVFRSLLAGNPLAAIVLAGILVAVFVVSSRLLVKGIRREDYRADRKWVTGWLVPFMPRAGTVVNLMLLELKLMWRSERPKWYFLFSVVFGTIYVGAPLLNRDVAGSTIIGAMIALYASGIFAMNYGQLMFAWESSYYDGIMVRRFRLEDLVLSKLLLLQYSCVVFFFLSLPLFAILAPHLVMMHVAFMIYNAGITCVLMVFLAIGNERRVALANVGFFNFEGFSIVHWLWFIPTVIPPAVLLYLMQDRQQTALVILWGIGAASLLFTKPWSSLFARQLRRRKYLMAAGFRHDEG